MKTPQPSYLTLSCVLNADNRGKGEATLGRVQGDKYFSKYDDYCWYLSTKYPLIHSLH